MIWKGKSSLSIRLHEHHSAHFQGCLDLQLLQLPGSTLVATVTADDKRGPVQ